MENATKALMIAAAVIVVILIISLGMGIFGNASEQVNNANNLSEYEIQKFNSKFLKYEGSAVRGTEVNAMLTTVFNHNMVQENEENCVAVRVDDGDNIVVDASTNATNTPEKVVAEKKYNVFCIMDKNTKLVTDIIVKTK